MVMTMMMMMMMMMGLLVLSPNLLPPSKLRHNKRLGTILYLR